MKASTKNDAKNKWRGILRALGFTDRELSGKHGPCPICKGNDRFRYTDYKGGGEYFCSGCGAGGGFDLLCQKFGWDFGHAAKEVDKVLGTDIKEVFKPKVDVEKRRRDLNSCWKRAAESPYPFAEYLIHRGISNLRSDMLKDIRGTSKAFLAGDTGEHNCMLALVRNKSGEPVSIHRTYTDEGIRKLMPPTESLVGAAIRLGEPGELLVIGEGIETTLSGMMRFGCCAGLATISAHGMETVVIPASVLGVIILADNDYSFTGQKSAFTLARRMDNDKKEVEVVMPSEADKDMNDFPTGILRWNNHEEG